MSESGVEFIRLQFVTLKRTEAQRDLIVGGLWRLRKAQFCQFACKPLVPIFPATERAALSAQPYWGELTVVAESASPWTGAIPNEWICAAKFAASLRAIEGGNSPFMRPAILGIEQAFFYRLDRIPYLKHDGIIRLRPQVVQGWIPFSRIDFGPEFAKLTAWL